SPAPHEPCWAVSPTRWYVQRAARCCCCVASRRPRRLKQPRRQSSPTRLPPAPERTPSTRTEVSTMTGASASRRTLHSNGYVGSIVINALLLYAVGHLVDWQTGWITPAWSDVV